MLRAVLLGDLRDLLDVADGQHGVRGRLAEDELRVRLHCLADVLRVPEVHEGELHAERREELPAGAVRAAVGAVRDDAMVAGLHGRADRARRRGHACAEGGRAVAVLERRQLRLQRRDRGVVRARVAVALSEVLLHGVLDEGRGEEQRRQHGAGQGLGLHRGVHEVRGQGPGAVHPCARLRGLGATGGRVAYEADGDDIDRLGRTASADSMGSHDAYASASMYAHGHGPLGGSAPRAGGAGAFFGSAFW
mmetsp:Transcript_71989/g.199589  ORF Transcript_71989/g.199589 Transcript_71989/m.199589 type:complete len:249 (-) Transcript_71989:12-758(-)